MDVLAKKLISDTHEDFSKDIIAFQDACGARTSFQELNDNQLREKLWETLFKCLSDNTFSSDHASCLSTLRILSRDKTKLNELITKERLNIILDNAGLSANSHQQIAHTNVTIESLKLLRNLVFNSVNVQQLIPTTSCLSYLIERMRSFDKDIPNEIIICDTVIVFLITALNVSTRQVVKNELRGDDCLIQMLENICLQCEKEGTSMIKKDDAKLVCEVLRALFNLYIQSDDSAMEEEERNKKLVSTLYKLLTLNCEKEDDLQSNVVNMLTVVPYDSYKAIIPPASDTCEHVYQNVDMTAISVLLKFLDCRLNYQENLIRNLSPIVTAFLKLVKSERLIRKYTRMQILPHLKDVMHRPEEGTTLRARLCKLLTSPFTELRDLVAEFLFVLCKENANRMVKYTGYGNAAGMFANKGLLGQSRGKSSSYSSESEDSETEEYLKHKEQINPVTGCFEHPKPNPLEGMTEEQKEYEAVRLVGLVDKLAREGLVQPCRIGEDGKPKPIEHVLELQEELPKQQYGRRDSDSD